MPRNVALGFYFLLFFLLAAFFVASYAHATPLTLYQNTDETAATSTDNYLSGGLYPYYMPASLSGILEGVNVAISADNSGQNLDVFVLCFTDSGHTSVCPEWGHASNGTVYSDGGAQNTPYGTSPTIYSYNYTTDTSAERTMRPDRYYALDFVPSNGAHQFVWGSASSLTPYLTITGAFGGDFTTFLDIISPTNGQNIPGNSVTFSYDYFNVSSTTDYTTATYLLSDLTTGQNMAGAATSTIPGDGLNTFTGTQTLTFGDTYSWQPELTGGTTSPNLFGLTYTFTLTSSTSTSVVVPSFFSGLWTKIQNNPPFGFIFQLKTQLQNLNASSTPAVTLNLATFEIDNVFSPFDTVLAGIMYLVFGIWAFKRFAHFEF